MQKSVNQLINYFKPEHYDLSLDIDRMARKFNGSVKVHGQQIGDEIRLHAKDLEISTIKVNGSNVKVSKHDNDEIVLSTKEKLDKCEIEISFVGRITDGAMHGLYPCFYEINGQKHELLATQLESHHAREIFPCVDEPAAKATFDLTLITENSVTALSNMPVKMQNTDEKLTTIFQTTPKMSTYLLAFVIGDLHKKSARTKRGIDVSVYATPAQPANLLDFALDTAVKTIDFYEDYFGVEYPLPKCDHVALPDFSAGAMENWGLITYRETALLADDSTGIATRKYIATVIAHETSHQWFGNLVTMRWWDDLWLNESFANMMEYVAIDALYPDWQIWEQFETGHVVAALRRDSLSGVQPVRQSVHHPDEIATLFDGAIVYGKGGRLLKMLRAYIGEDSLRNGLREYFRRFAYQNTCGDDLWQCLSQASGKDCRTLMNPWLTQPGYPVVSAHTDDNQIKLTQQQFFIDGGSSDQIWPIPLFANDDKSPEVFDSKTILFKPGEIRDFQLNVGNNSHFVTQYDETLRHNLFKEIDQFDIVDRLKILNEMTMLVRAGFGSATDYIDILQKLSVEENDAVRSIMSIMIGDLKRFTEGNDELREHLNKLVTRISQPLYKKLGWKSKPNENINDTELRSTIIGNMIFAGNRDAINEAIKIYESNKDNLRQIDGDFRSIILTAVVRFGEDMDFHYLYDIYKTTQDGDLRDGIASALTSSDRPDNINEMITNLTKLNIVRPQDTFRWIAYLLANYKSRDATWNFVCDNWGWIEATFGGDKSLDDYVRIPAGRLSTREHLDEFVQFFMPMLDQPALRRAIEVGIRDIESRVEWLERDRAAVEKRLEEIDGDKEKSEFRESEA